MCRVEEPIVEYNRERYKRNMFLQMILQNRVVLDYPLASQGGVCKIIGDHCCTFIPDSASNYSAIVNHLNDLQANLQTEKDEWGRFDITSWFIQGGWMMTLLKIAAPILCILYCIFDD